MVKSANKTTLRKKEEINRKWPFQRESEIKLP